MCARQERGEEGREINMMHMRKPAQLLHFQMQPVAVMWVAGNVCFPDVTSFACVLQAISNVTDECNLYAFITQISVWP